jgi:DNA-directed RNA polymerase beta' subunit
MSVIKLLDVEKFASQLKEVSSTEIHITKGTFHPDGLFSEVIFGPIETKERSTTFGFIDLNTKVIHPSLIAILKRLSRNILNAINREGRYNIDAAGTLVPDKEGIIHGISSVIENMDKIKFRGGTEQRDRLVKKINEFIRKDLFFISKYPVMPVAFRDIRVEGDGVAEYDEINDYYLEILRLSLQLTMIPEGTIFDILSSNMQQKVQDLYSYISSKISKKEGLIRHDILGKRVDYSARAVVVGSGNELKSNEIGVPMQIAVKLFEPFIVFQLLNSKSIDKDNLKSLVYEYNKTELSVSSIRTLLDGIYKGDEIPKELEDNIRRAISYALTDKVVVAKRDPVLHSEGTLAFYPILVEGKVLKLNPLLCDGYNADFDGDQMALFVPVTNEAIQEAKDKMMTTESKDGMGKTSLSFSADSIAGMFAATRTPKPLPKSFPVLKDEREIDDFKIYEGVTYNGEKTTIGRVLFNQNLPKSYPFVNEPITKSKFKSIQNQVFRKYNEEVYRKFCDDMLRLGFKYYTIAPGSFAINDLDIPPSLIKLKKQLKGTDPETAQKILDQMEKELEKFLKTQPDNGLSILAQAGVTKGGYGQLRQVLVAKGLIADVEGNVLPPFDAAFADGMDSKQYFELSPGTRKGIVNRALNTATTGYLARQLIYACQSVEVDTRIKDCKTKKYLEIIAKPDIAKRLEGRVIMTKKGILRLFNPKTDTNKKILLRSPLYCKSRKLCLTCYGQLALRNDSPYVGIIAASIIGEKGTQLIMRTFHTGGAVGIDSIDLISQTTDNYDEMTKKEFKKLFIDKDSQLIANNDCTIEIKKSDFMDPKADIQINDTVKLAYGYFILRSGGKEFDITLDYEIDINIPDGYDEDENTIIIPVKKGNTVLTAKPTSTDFTQAVKVTTALLSGRKAWKDEQHFFMKVFDQYASESDADLVHFETVVSNLLRDKINPRMPARLNPGKYDAIVTNIKNIPVYESWLSSLEFENFNKSIETAMIYPRPPDESILERLVTGNL